MRFLSVSAELPLLKQRVVNDKAMHINIIKCCSLCRHYFCLEMSSAFPSAAYIQVHFRLDVFMEVNNINPDQTAPKGAVRSGFILFEILATPDHKQRRGTDVNSRQKSKFLYEPTTVGSRSTNTALGTCFPAPVSLKKVLNESSPPPMVLSLGIWPSGWIPCSRQYNSQQALPIWTPACPTWMDTHSRWKKEGTLKT